jgi:hypothetical protein
MVLGKHYGKVRNRAEQISLFSEFSEGL